MGYCYNESQSSSSWRERDCIASVSAHTDVSIFQHLLLDEIVTGVVSTQPRQDDQHGEESNQRNTCNNNSGIGIAETVLISTHSGTDQLYQ